MGRTGGGPLTHYVAEPDGGEPCGQPGAFDSLTFGAHCPLSPLTRFQLRNLIEGRPACDDE